MSLSPFLRLKNKVTFNFQSRGEIFLRFTVYKIFDNICPTYGFNIYKNDKKISWNGIKTLKSYAEDLGFNPILEIATCDFKSYGDDFLLKGSTSVGLEKNYLLQVSING